MRSDFAACGMLPRGHASGRQMSHILQLSDLVPDGKDGDEVDAGAVEGDNVLAHVVLAQTHGTSICLLKQPVLTCQRSMQIPTGHGWTC